MKTTPIPGFTTDTTPDDKLAIGIIGPEGSGKTRLALTGPECQGWLITDRKTKRTIDDWIKDTGSKRTIYSNKDDFMNIKEAMQLAVEDDLEKVKAAYTEVEKRFIDSAIKLVEHPDVELIVTDSGTTLCDYISFAHFGRKEKNIQRSWGAPKQDYHDLMQAMKKKNVAMTFQSKDVFVNDKNTGRKTWNGLPNVGYEMNVIVEMSDKRKVDEDQGETWIDRFTLGMIQCQYNKALEGDKELLVGDAINWDVLMATIGIE